MQEFIHKTYPSLSPNLLKIIPALAKRMTFIKTSWSSCTLLFFTLFNILFKTYEVCNEIIKKKLKKILWFWISYTVRAPSTFNRTSSADAASQVQIQTQPFGPWKSLGPWNPRTPTQPNPTLAQFREICLIFLVVYFQPGFRHITRRLWVKTRYPSTQYLLATHHPPL